MNDTQINLSKEEVTLVWEALSQFSENRGTDELGEQLELPVLDALVERFDALFVPQEKGEVSYYVIHVGADYT